MTRTTQQQGPTHQACYFVTALAGVCALVVIDVWALISVAMAGQEMMR